MRDLIQTVVIGGGQAGLAMSYHLRQAGLEHIVVERARIAESWRTERWDSLMFQFPNWSIKLPGYAFVHQAPDDFAPKGAVVEFIQEYATRIKAPVRCNFNVAALQQDGASQRFLIKSNGLPLEASNVVVATGSYHQPVVPEFASSISPAVFQIHTRDYRNPGQLPPGSILVIGSGASGAQIAEELLQSGRRVFLSAGRHDKVPRRYRQKDLFWWLEAMGIWRLQLEHNPEYRTWRPIFTGMRGGHNIDLQQFARDGMTLLGRLKGTDGLRLYFASDLESTLAKSEIWFLAFRQEIDRFAETHDLKHLEGDGEDQPLRRRAEATNNADALDLNAAGISAIIWAGGFRYDFGWIELPVFDETGEPKARRGVCAIPGLYFLGLRRTYATGSSLLAGVGDEAAYLAEQIAARR